VAWASEESMQRLADQLIDNINAFALAGASTGWCKRRLAAPHGPAAGSVVMPSVLAVLFVVLVVLVIASSS
jgi:hypothetical protein